MRSAFVVIVGLLIVGCEPAVEGSGAHEARAVTRRPPSPPVENGSAQRSYDSAPNEAAAFWRVQESARERAWHIVRGEGRQGLAWLRVASIAAGEDARFGSLVEAPDGTWSFKPGGDVLRILRSDGVAFSLRVLALEGAVTSADFPRAGDSLKTSLEFADGRGWECTLSGAQGDGADDVQVHTGCVGEFGDEGFAAEVDAVEREVLTQFSNPHGTRVGGLASIDATIEVDGAEVRFTTSDAYANCSDSERCPAFVDRVTMSGRVSNEKLSTAFEWERALTTDEANRAARVEWSGTISRDGVDVGSMHKRALIEDRVALEVTLDGDAFTTQTVFGN